MMFKGRKLVIATKHKKETIIAPILEKEIGVRCFVPENFDSDKLGTFSGEIERTDSALDTVRKKCLLAMEAENCDLGIASEGSFGPHPASPFISANDELVIFIDTKNNLEIIGRHISLDTNFSGTEVNSIEKLKEFSQRIGFPEHALILREKKNSNRFIKGITNHNDLNKAFSQLNLNGKAYVETDMRAMHNPNRMLVIEEACKKLVESIKNYCPNCNTPGFSVTKTVPGLPCGACGLPTKSTLFHLYTCKSCGHTEEKKYPNGIKANDPMYCDFCNP